MSYSVDLWNCYNKLENQLESHLKGLKVFIYIFSEYYSSQLNFSNELKRLSDYIKNNPITTFESLNEGISAFQNDLLNQHDYFKEFLTNIKIEIIEPLKLIKDKITKRLNDNLNETNTNEKNYNNLLAKFENAKIKFHKSVKEVEQNKLDIELLKKSKNSQDKLIEELKKQEIKALNSLKYAKEKENDYISLINDINNLQEEYIEIKKMNLNELQNMEEEIGLNIKDSLRKYIIYQVSYIRNFQYDMDKKAKIMENINIIKDISNFIYKNTTKEIPPLKYDYIPYLSDINKNKNNLKIDKEIIDDINNFIENNFTSNKAKEIILLKNKINLDIESITEEIFVSKINIEDFDKIKIEKIKKYCKDKKHRREILKNLNNLRRIKGLNINTIAYNNIGKILNLCLNDVYQELTNIDYFSLVKIISSSSTLYKISDDSKEKIFLNKYIKSHEIWKKYDTWKNAIKYSINEEMHNQKNFNIYTEEDFNIKKKRINNIVKFQINYYIYNMIIYFEVKKSYINDIISEFKIYYDLSEDIVETFNNIIENKSKDI
jgi:hypothetical protein